MDLRGIANSCSNVVNPNITVTWQKSTGFTIGNAGKQIPTYAAGVIGPAQVQALDNSQLKQLEGLNIQGDIRALYMYGNLAGVIRPNQQGGDLIVISSGPLQGTWLITKTLESWPAWTAVAIVKQGGA